MSGNGIDLSRLSVLVAGILLSLAAVAGRLYQLQILEHETYLEDARHLTADVEILTARRGEVRDANGTPLVRSVVLKSVSANPQFVGDFGPLIAAPLAQILRVNEEQLREQLVQTRVVDGRRERSPWVGLKNLVEEADWKRIEALMRETYEAYHEQFAAQGLEREFKTFCRKAIYAESLEAERRVYPFETMAANVLGYVRNLEGAGGPRGYHGIESIFDEHLRGVHGWRRVQSNIVSRELPDQRGLEVPAQHGADVVLTLDVQVQHILEEELQAVLDEHGPKRVSGVVVRPATGEILGMATLPGYHPNHFTQGEMENMKNRLIEDVMEPGSTFKIVVLAAALEEGTAGLDAPIDCEGGAYYYGGRILHDHHPYGVLPLRTVIAKSSNIGSAKLALGLGTSRFYDYVRRFGYGTATGIPLPGEVGGLMIPEKRVKGVDLTRIAIGQSIAVTGLQTAMAFSAVANGGILMKPLLVRAIESGQGDLRRFEPEEVRRVVSERTAARMREALKGVTAEGGTATRAALEHYEVAGKTGTAQKPIPGGRGYAPGLYYSSFVGFFPADRPELCIFVGVDEPPYGHHYGGVVAAPAFRRIGERVANLFNIPPDRRDLLAGARRSRP